MFRSVSFARAALVGVFVAGVVGGAVSATTSAGLTAPPEPMPTCLPVLMSSGDAQWYCGDVIRIPQGASVMERGLIPCGSEDGSGGPLPCRWDARMRGDHRGSSFTVLPDGDPVDGMRRVLYRYDSGLTAHGQISTQAESSGNGE